MNRRIARSFYFFLGLLGLLSLLCSIAAGSVTNAALMKQGFLQYAQTEHLNVPASRYGDYAAALSDYLDGKTDLPRVPAYDGGGAVPAFSDKENAHLRDVRGIVSALKGMRWIGGGGTVALLAVLYLTARDKQRLLSSLVRGFALAALFLLALATALAVWGAVNFRGLFWTFHQAAFTNDLWLLDPGADLLVALMPISFFAWYAGEMAKSLLPVLGMMALLIIAWMKTSKEQKKQ